MAVGQNKKRIAITITKEEESIIKGLAKERNRTKASMAAKIFRIGLEKFLIQSK